MTTRVRLLLVLPPYVAAVWWTTFAGLDGDDAFGLIAFLLIGAGLFVVVQVTWLRGLFRPTDVFIWNPAVLTGLGLAFGAASSGEAAVGAAVGLAVGVLTAFVSLWLGDLTQLQRRPRVFLNYRRDDTGSFAGPLYRLLAARYGRRNVFVDVQSLQPGRDFRHELRRVIQRCDAVVAVIGPRWAELRDDRGRRRLDQENDYLRIELETALAADLPVIPVLVDNAGLPTEDQVPDSLRALPYLQGASLRPGTDFDRDFEALLGRFEETLQLSTRNAITLRRPRTRPFRRLRIAAFVLVLLMPIGWAFLDTASSDVRSLNDAALSPDGNRIVSVHGTGVGTKASLRLWNARSGKLEAVRRYAGGDPPVWTVRWSPDGRWLATGDHEGMLQIWDAERLTVVRSLSGTQGMLEELAWSPDSTKVATGDDFGTVRVWRVDTGALVATAPLFSEQVSALAWSPGGKEIAAGSWDTTVLVLRLGPDRLLPVSSYDGHRSFVTRLAWSPDGTRLASGSLEAPFLALHVLEDGRSAKPSVTLQQPGVVNDLGWSPDGAWLASASHGEDSVRVWDPQGRLRHALSLRSAYEPNVAWAPDSSAFASADEQAIHVWSVRDGGQIASLAGHQDGAGVVGWSTDGRRLVSRARFDDDIRVWDVERERSTAVFRMTVWDGLLNLF
jgi:WD40 repeat protein